jgi:transcriptional regulator with XRE-family HTH domain
MRKISLLRKQKGVSQSKLAEILGVSLRTVQNYESGKVTVPSEKLNQIAKYFCVTVSELFNTKSDDSKEETTQDSSISTDEVMRLLELLFFHEEELKEKYPMYAKWENLKVLTAYNDGAEAMKKKLIKGNE